MTGRPKEPRWHTRATPIHFFTGRCPQGMPRGEWEWIRKPAWPFFLAYSPALLMCAAQVSMLLNLRSSGARPALIVLILGGSLGMIVSVLWLWSIPGHRERRFRRKLRRLEYQLCLNCGYDLTGLPEVHRCPECGAAFDKVQVRRTWKAWFGEAQSA